MGNATLGLTLSYTDQAGTPHAIALSQTDSFTQISDQDLVTAGAASEAIPLGTMASAKFCLIEATSGAITVKLDGEATGHAVANHGLMGISGAAISGARIAHAAATKTKVVLLG